MSKSDCVRQEPESFDETETGFPTITAETLKSAPLLGG